ncbi:hypothetical protein [Schlesneria sp. T3-172]|uniref:hypothetical protein n=1 Tax=Schlesneria sphaerica TaxID=3373610 RepID=UPI0037CBDEA0
MKQQVLDRVLVGQESEEFFILEKKDKKDRTRNKCGCETVWRNLSPQNQSDDNTADR